MTEEIQSNSPVFGLEAIFKSMASSITDSLPRLQQEPSTVMHELLGKLKNEIDRDPETYSAELLRFFFGGALGEVVKSLLERHRVKYEADSRAVEMRRLFDSADSKVPHVTYVEAVKWHSENRAVNLVEAFNRLEQARNSQGEIRARAVIGAIDEVTERLYRPYLSLLYRIHCYSCGEEPRKNLITVGVLVTELRKRISVSSPLVDWDAGWFRNAAAHASWEFMPEHESLDLWDHNRPRKSYSPADLLRRVENMASSTKVCGHELMSKMLEGNLILNEFYAPYRAKFISEDPELQKQAIKALDELYPADMKEAMDKVGITFGLC